MKEEAAAALTAEKQGKEAAEKALGEAMAQLDRTMRAAAGGMGGGMMELGAAPGTPENALPPPTLSDGTGPAAASGRTAGALLSMQLPDASAAALRRENLTMTELYTKYAEASDAWRKECAERRRLQATIDGMISELEQRAPLLSEQRAEYERAVSAHGEMRLRLEVGPANYCPPRHRMLV